MPASGDQLDPIRFNASPRPTVGVEVETWLVDSDSGALTQQAHRVLSELTPAGAEAHPKLKHELFLSTVEAITGICDTVAQAGDDLRATFEELRSAAEHHGIDLMASGTHPFSRWQEQQVSPNERYEDFLARLGWPVQRLAICGIHVHVGVSSGEAAIAITRALGEQLPLLLALSAASPFWNGDDTALCSARTKVFEALPTAGLPPMLDDWADFESFMHGLLRAKVIDSIREVWWDVRPHPDFGTVELRMCDAVPTLRETLAIAALAQCLVVHYERQLAAGESLPMPRDWVSSENKWLACRHGVRAELLVGDQGNRRSVVDLIAETVATLSPTAEELGCGPELDSALALARAGTSADRQRAVLD
ncbi:MAG: glutamate--cysteine ligase, partial [Microthrixaceae bacterium]